MIQLMVQNACQFICPRISVSVLSFFGLVATLLVGPLDSAQGANYFWENFAGQRGGSGNTDGTASEARFSNPNSVAVTADGTLYVISGNQIRKISTAGIVTTFAGGDFGFEDGVGIAAKFRTPTSIASGGDGSLFVADHGNHRIRKISPTGVVTTLAGGSPGFADGTGAEAKFNFPNGLALGPDGSVFVTELLNHAIRKISPAGVVSTLAGSSQGSVDGQGAAAQFDSPRALTVDAVGNVYVAEYYRDTIRKVTPAGLVTTIEPTGIAADGVSHEVSNLRALEAGADGTLYLIGNDVKTMSPAGVISHLAGDPAGGGYSDGLGAAARFNLPGELDLDAAGNVYLADAGNQTIRKIAPSGEVTTVAGSAPGRGFVNGPSDDARFASPWDCAVDADGNVYVADRFNYAVRKISPSGQVTTLAGGSYGGLDGVGPEAQFWFPSGVAVDGNGFVYVADPQARTIRKINPNGSVSTLAGRFRGNEDGTGDAARFAYPAGLAVDASGNVFVADTFNYAVRKITPAGVVSTLAGGNGRGYVDAVGGEAKFEAVWDVAVDGGGNVYVADVNGVIRVIDPAGSVSTLAGSGEGYADGPAGQARFSHVYGLEVDADGNVYVADTGNHTIRRISPGGDVITLGGMPENFGGADGVGDQAVFNGLTGITVASNGTLYVVDAADNRVIRGTPSTIEPPSIETPAGALPTGTVSTGYQWALDGGDSTSVTWSVASGELPPGVSLSPTGVLRGTAAQAGEFTFVVSATNAGGATSREFTIVIDEAGVEGVIYVDSRATGAGDGTTWRNAFPALQDALAIATAGNQIWIAGGIYYPDIRGGVDTDESFRNFVIPSGITVAGGFVGNESSPADRPEPWVPTVLSGDIDGDDANDDGNFIAESVDDIRSSNTSYSLVQIDAGSVRLEGLTLTAATRVEVGGGLKVTRLGAGVEIIRCDFLGNSAGTGGALHLDVDGGDAIEASSELRVEDCVFSGNRATGFGGAVSVLRSKGRFRITRSAITGNRSEVHGGGFYASTGGNRSGSIQIDASQVSDNVADEDGAAIYAYLHGSTSLSVHGSTFERNLNADGLGSIFCLVNDGGFFELEGSVIAGNDSNQDAGLSMTSADGSVARIRNCLITGNTGFGLRLFNNEDSEISLVNSTVAGNGSGLLAAGPVVTNTIISGNGVNVSLLSRTTFSHSLSDDWTPSLRFIDAGGNVVGDPGFVSPVDPTVLPTVLGNFRLTAGSVAVDGGQDPAAAGLLTDLAGAVRIIGDAVDIGAYEFAGAGSDPTPTPMPTPTPTAAEIDAVPSIVSDWGAGFQGGIVVRNPGTSSVETWTIEVEFVGTGIASLWGGTIEAVATRVEAGRIVTTYSIRPEAWNARIAPGAQVEIGFLGTQGDVAAEDIIVTATLDVAPSAQEIAVYDLASARVTVRRESDWQQGAVLKFRIENTSGVEITDWTLAAIFDRAVSSIWNATVRSRDGSALTIDATDAAWQKHVPIGGAVEFGLQVAPGALTALPLVTAVVGSNAVVLSSSREVEPEMTVSTASVIKAASRGTTLMVEVESESPITSLNVRAKRQAVAKVRGNNPYRITVRRLQRGQTKVVVIARNVRGERVRKVVKVTRSGRHQPEGR